MNNKLTIKQIVKDFKDNKYSPKELLEETIKTIKRKDPHYHAFVSLILDKAKESISKKQKGLLYGIPSSLKDNFNWEGTKTTASSNMLKSYISPYNATAVENLLTNSACIVGKTNMDAFAHGSSTETSDFFTTLNPYDDTKVSGGSSGGSAVAVALGMSVYALGTETAGSVRGPASWCGVVGFVPTYGRISRYGIIAMSSSLDRVGVFTNSVEDSAILLEILSGKDTLDATTIQEVPQKLQNSLDMDLRGLRIGLPKQYFNKNFEKEVLDRTIEVSKLLESKGAKLLELDLLDSKYSIATYTIIQRSEVASNLARMDGIRYGYMSTEEASDILEQISYNRGEGLGFEAKQRSVSGTFSLFKDNYEKFFHKAQKVRTLIIEDFAKSFDGVDVILAPTMPSVAPKLGVIENNPVYGELADILTEPSALAGLPCINIPAGLDSNDMPIGVQLIAKQYAEKTVLSVAHKLEKLLN